LLYFSLEKRFFNRPRGPPGSRQLASSKGHRLVTAGAGGGIQGLQHRADWQQVALRQGPPSGLAGCCSDRGRGGEECGRGHPAPGSSKAGPTGCTGSCSSKRREDCSLGLPGAGQLIGGPLAGSWGARAPGRTRICQLEGAGKDPDLSAGASGCSCRLL